VPGPQVPAWLGDDLQRQRIGPAKVAAPPPAASDLSDPSNPTNPSDSQTRRTRIRELPGARVSPTMIVRNKENNLGRSVEFVQNLFHEVVVLDTAFVVRCSCDPSPDGTSDACQPARRTQRGRSNLTAFLHRTQMFF
jgi:hypothetical protein